MTSSEKIASAESSIRKVMLLGYNISFEQFTVLLEKMLNQKLNERYVEEHWDRMRADFSRWLLDLDIEARCRFISAAFEKYGE